MNQELAHGMARAGKGIAACAKDHALGLRQAAFALAFERVARVTDLCGV